MVLPYLAAEVRVSCLRGVGMAMCTGSVHYALAIAVSSRENKALNHKLIVSTAAPSIAMMIAV